MHLTNKYYQFPAYQREMLIHIKNKGDAVLKKHFKILKTLHCLATIDQSGIQLQTVIKLLKNHETTVEKMILMSTGRQVYRY